MARVVLDNCVPRTLLRHLALPGATTVGDLGWAHRIRYDATEVMQG